MKTKKPKVKPEKWKRLDTRDIKYDSFTLTEMLDWVKEKTPKGTSNDDIKFDFEVNYHTWYYDEIVIEAEMRLYVREK